MFLMICAEGHFSADGSKGMFLSTRGICPSSPDLKIWDGSSFPVLLLSPQRQMLEADWEVFWLNSPQTFRVLCCRASEQAATPNSLLPLPVLFWKWI